MKSKDLELVLFFSSIGTAAGLFYLPLLLEERGISEVQIGLLAIIFSIALLLSNALFGKLADNYNRRKILLFGLLTSTFSLMSYIFPQNIYSFAVIRVLNGISLGIYPAAIITIASSKRVKLGKLSSWGSFGWSIGVFIIGFLAEIYQLEVAFIISALVFFISFIVALLFTTDITKENLFAISQIQKSRKYSDIIKINWQIYLSVILRHGTAHSIWVYWALFLQDDLSLNKTQIGIVLAINPITQFFVMKILTDRGDPRKNFLLGLFISSIAFISFPFANTFLEISLTQVILGFSWAFFYVGGLRSIEVQNIKTNSLGSATGLFNSSISVSQVIGPIFAILIYAKYQTYIAEMYFAAIVTSITFIFFSVWTLRTNILDK